MCNWLVNPSKGSVTVGRLALRTVCALTVALEETNTAEKGLESMLIGKTEIFRDENCSALSTSTDVDQLHRPAAISSALPVPRELTLEQPFFFSFLSFFFFFFFFLK